MKNDLTRRRFIQMSAVGFGGVLLLSQCTKLSSKSYWRFFKEREASLVDAIIEQIIPTDEWPGAKDADVTNYIDKQLVGPLTRHQEKYRRGLAGVATSCKILYQKQFEDISWNEQTDFLKKMEAGKLAGLLKDDKTGQQDDWKDGFDRTFFSLVCDHTMQGFYGSPRHGGNLNYVSYKMIGLDYPFSVGQNRY